MKSFNLLPWRKARRNSIYRQIALAAILPFCIASIGLELIYKHEKRILQSKLQYGHELSLQESRLHDQAQYETNSWQKQLEIERRLTQLQILNQEQQQLFYLLLYLGALLPQKVSITSWHYHNHSLQWTGQATQAHDIIVLAKNLSAVSMFSSVQVKQISSIQNSQDHTFTIQALVHDASRKN